ncbi:hypothetical protein B9Z55_013743 [Caenorhabditis nigoni]|uniref:SXP/RAL-2 family protein Ani s 5-like cation-binding domain-containing protein n=1 Tax=Caenorhabditis nigoni TaxID=1611254 RepID=A0A2G5U3Y9_9PELO|nr:hypothetical protein B9Z55_013743 [Caenorhabditis nigoni]
MKTFFLIFSVLLVSLALVGAEDSEEQNVETPKNDVKPWKKHDFRKREPEFLKEMAQDAKTAYFGIKFNPELTKADKTQQLKDWADKYDVEDEMQKFLDDKKSDCDRKKKERKENYERLGELIEKANEILEDQDNTWNGANEKLDALVKDENREVLKAFQSFYPFVGRDNEGPRHGHHGHRFHHGRRFGRNIGHGAAPKHHGGGIGSGISYNDPPRINNENYNAYGRNEPNERHHKKHHHQY